MSPTGRAWAWWGALAILVPMVALFTGCGQESAGDGSHSYVSEGSDAVWYVGWDGEGDGQIRGSFRVTFFNEDSGEVDTTEYTFTGEAEGSGVTVTTPDREYAGEVEGGELTLEYNDDGEIKRNRYREGTLDDYGQASAEYTEDREALAEVEGLAEELGRADDLLEDQALVVEETAIPSLVGGTGAKREQVEEMSAALEDLRRASETYGEGEYSYCSDLPDLPYDNTRQEPSNSDLGEIEQLRYRIKDVREDLDALGEATRAAPGDAAGGTGETKEEAEEALDRAEEVEEVASEALQEWDETEESVRTEILELEKEEEEVRERLDC